MKNRRKNLVCWILTPIILLALSVYYSIQTIPTTIFVREGEQIKNNYFIKLNENKDIKVSNTIGKTIRDRKAQVTLLGFVPIKSITVKSVPTEIMLYPGGQPVGVKLNTKGVLVVALSDIDSENGKVSSPSATAGLQIGDSIIKINNTEVTGSEQVAREINSLEGKEISVIVERKGVQFEKTIKPIRTSTDSKYKIGLWIRDSTAGVGTLTFYDDKSKKFAALGHPITDVDTGTILSVNKGEIVSSSIVSVKKGLRGNPGELKGIFVDEENLLGQIYKNTECGIFGSSEKSLINNSHNKPMKIALRDEIKTGPAKVLTTIEGNEPKLYDIEIEKLLQQDTPGPKSMVIKVTDPILLEKTGGIVQGMSGSPIIQNNKIIGAVTHVLINKPDTGYGIYIEWMLKDADILSK